MEEASCFFSLAVNEDVKSWNSKTSEFSLPSGGKAGHQTLNMLCDNTYGSLIDYHQGVGVVKQKVEMKTNEAVNIEIVC